MKRTPEAMRFEFGRNWRSFVSHVGEEQVREAEASLREKLGDIRGKSFLDVGCGSGLFSLAALRLGVAPVRSFDYDAGSVEAARLLKSQFAPDADWTIDQGDATDREFMESLGRFDLVYAWGILHHTGAMWAALENTYGCVTPGGTLFVSIYNDQGKVSTLWRAVKRLYNQTPPPLRRAYAIAVMLPWEIRAFLRYLSRRRPQDYVREWTRPGTRGMSRWHDLIDWVGGYPFEVAKPEEVFRFCRARGFELIELKTVGGEAGCNEFIFARTVDEART
jgi:SAM-dependent methyltransferase